MTQELNYDLVELAKRLNSSEDISEEDQRIIETVMKDPIAFKMFALYTEILDFPNTLRKMSGRTNIMRSDMPDIDRVDDDLDMEM